MNINVENNRFIDASDSNYIPVGTDHIKEYLADKWQRVFDELSIKNNDALIMYVAIKEKGYEINIASHQAQAYYDLKRVLEPSGADFIDLVRGYGKLIAVEDIRKDIRLAGAKELVMGFRSVVGLPIIDHQSVMQGILLIMERQPRSIDEEYLREALWLASSVEESVRYLAVESEIDGIRNVDHLTRLVSRDRMMTTIQLEFERSQRSDMPFSMVLIDIDNFRNINETFGHEVGDRVLQEFSEEIAARIRLVDTACRWDGDAFAVLCPQTDLLGANMLVNDLFANLCHHIFPDVGRCFFSMGIADFSPRDESINEMILRLDKALYRVKAFGGNSHETRYH